MTAHLPTSMRPAQHGQAERPAEVLRHADAYPASPVYLVGVGLAVLFLFAAPFQKALFNGGTPTLDYPIYVYMALSAVLLLLTALLSFKYGRESGYRETLAAGVWLIPLSYGIASISAVSHQMSLHAVCLHTMYASFFVMAAACARRKSGSRLLAGSILGSGYVVVLFGFMTMFGSMAYPDAFKRIGTQYRLSSVFQYPNSYSAYLIGLLLSSLWLLSGDRGRPVKTAGALMLVPVMLSFIMTLSRGGMLLLPLIVLLILPMMGIARQVLLGLHFLIALAAALLITGRVTDIAIALQSRSSASLSSAGWLTVAAASAAAAAAALLLQRYGAPLLQAMERKHFNSTASRFVLPLGVILFAGLGMLLTFDGAGIARLMPQSLQQRFESIDFQQHAFLERITFIQDGFKLLRDYPLTGAGGGAWSALYETYQSNPYVSSQTHNYYLQTAVETGWIGLGVLLLFLVAVFFCFWRSVFIRQTAVSSSTMVFYIVAVAILLHSFMDFNMSYAYLAALVFLCLGGMIAGAETKEAGVAAADGEGMDKLRKRKLWHKVYPAALLLIAAVLYGVSLISLYSNYMYRQALDGVRQGLPPEQVADTLDRALAVKPDHPDYVLMKIGLLNRLEESTKEASYNEEIVKLIKQLREKEPYGKRVLEAEYDHYMNRGELSSALQTVKFGLQHFPWDMRFYDRSVALQYNIGNKARQIKDQPTVDSYWDGALASYQAMQERIAALKQLPKGQRYGREFYVTHQMKFAAGQIYYFREDYTRAAHFFKSSLDRTLREPLDRMIGIWYIAALRQQGLKDQALYQKLSQLEPELEKKLFALQKYTDS